MNHILNKILAYLGQEEAMEGQKHCHEGQDETERDMPELTGDDSDEEVPDTGKQSLF